MTIKAPLTAALLALPLPLMAEDLPAEFSCTFTTECLSGEACDATDYSVTLNLETAGKSPAVTVVKGLMTSDAETRDLMGFWKDGTFTVESGGEFPASLLITGERGGAAIYTDHLSTDFGITYLGTCE